jgi:hypothetical protein
MMYANLLLTHHQTDRIGFFDDDEVKSLPTTKNDAQVEIKLCTKKTFFNDTKLIITRKVSLY